MITLTIVSYNNQAPASPLSATFGKEGKTLGRSRDNHLVLVDPGNHVSRTQALVRSDGMRHAITNLSRATPILVNGAEIETNRECSLNPGDEIRIGLYLLRAEAGPGASQRVDLRSVPTAGSGALESDTVLMPGQSAHAASPAAPTARMSGQRELIEAFLAGAGIPDATLPQGLTPEIMEMIGRLLAVSVQGAMDLNALRALTKREANADVTMVVVRNNNPLKFLPDAETVLTHMFRKKMPGFMGPVEAIEDTYADLHAHQLGMVAGIRAALADLLARLDPQALEKKVEQPSFLESLRPAGHKARLWDAYVELNRELAAQAQDDFQLLFGRAFLQAYARQVEQARNAGDHG